MKYQLSKKSLNILSTCCGPLQKIAKIAIIRTQFDFGINSGYRDKELQDKLYNSKPQLSKLKWPNSKHNIKPSEAFDFYIWDHVLNRATWDDQTERYYYMYGLFDSIAHELGYKIRSGANWDLDDQLKDQTFNDLGHIEYVGEI